uniref:Ixodegrin B n=1 Tax=Rhipicephalus zambeziensis TaxID=60191 RepID=A0A224YB27_9ACAR
MTQLLVSCVVLYLTILTLQVATQDDGYQRRVDTPFFNSISQTGYRNRKKSAGQFCRSTSECRDHLCCSTTRRGTTCKPRSRFGYMCTDEQAKGGIYLGGCPCLDGNGECYVYRRRTNIGVCTHIR